MIAEAHRIETSFGFVYVRRDGLFITYTPIPEILQS
jgi:hypothetical protein